jgi:hypothetical protein
MPMVRIFSHQFQSCCKKKKHRTFP